MKNRVIILCRISTQDQESNTSLEGQEKSCREFADSRSWNVVRVFREVESGALYQSRLETMAALKMIEDDEADILLLYDVSRYGRDVEYQHKMLKRITRARKQLQIATLPLEYDPYSGDLTPESEQMLTIMGGTSSWERANIRRRTRNGLLRTAREGRQPCTRFPPLGYYIVKRDDIVRGAYPPEMKGRYVVVEAERELPLQIFQAYDRLQSARAVAGLLNTQGVPTRSGQPWLPAGVHKILSNPVYKGEASYGRFRHHTDESRMADGRNKKYRGARNPDVITIEAPPLVPVDLWERVQTKLANGARRSGPAGKRYMLTGLLVCPRCGGGLNRSPLAPLSDGTPRYSLRCRASKPRAAGLSATCESVSYDGRTIERLTLEALRHIMLKPQALTTAATAFTRRQESEQRARRQATAPDVSAIKRDIEALRAREAAAVEAAIDARIAGHSALAYEAAAARSARERTALEAKLDVVPALAVPPPVRAVAAEEVATLLDTLEDESISGHERGLLLASYVERLYPLPVGEYGCEASHPHYKTGGVALVLPSKSKEGPHTIVWNRLKGARHTINVEVCRTLPFERPKEGEDSEA